MQQAIFRSLAAKFQLRIEVDWSFRSHSAMLTCPVFKQECSVDTFLPTGRTPQQLGLGATITGLVDLLDLSACENLTGLICR